MHMKKILSLLLTAVMLVSLLPVTAFAKGGGTITVIGGTADPATYTNSQTTVNLTAEDPASFTEWVVTKNPKDNSGSEVYVDILNSDDPCNATFMIPSGCSGEIKIEVKSSRPAPTPEPEPTTWNLVLPSDELPAGIQSFTVTEDDGSIISSSNTAYTIDDGKTAVVTFTPEEGYTVNPTSVEFTSATVVKNWADIVTAEAEEAPAGPDYTKYYLVGWINDQNSGCESDWESLHSEYQFSADGTLEATFTTGSYVFVKTSDNAHWYSAPSYVASSASVSATLAEGNSEKVGVEGNVPVCFTLTENTDGTLSLSYEPAAAPTTGITSVEALQTAITVAGTTETTIQLTQNLTATGTDSALIIANGQNITLDLNGKTISRGLETAAEGGNVITVFGTLTVQDSSNPSTGKITGGKNTEAGGGIYVCAGGKFTLESGAITGNSAAVAGGVIVESGAEFVMTGGKISGNTVSTEGAGVFLMGSLTMTGGEISGNTAGSIGGGVCCVAGSTLTVGGNAKITGNTASGVANNVYLCTGTIIGVSDSADLASPAAIGVTAQTAPTAVQPTTISGSTATAGNAAFFASDNALYAVNFNTDHLELVENTDTWAALQSKINEAVSPVSIKLNKNITATATDSALLIPEGKTVTIDLNGFTLDRGLKEKTAAENGNVIIVNGNLTVKDSSNPSTGKITGGNSSNLRSGGVVVDQGTFTLESGLICNNKSAQNGGGVLVLPGTSFTMKGGKITGNTTSNGGGGVFCQGSFAFEDGEISGNSAKSGAGVYVYASDDTSHTVTKYFTMTGGKVINNVASDKGGGIYADNYDIGTKLLGGEISGNTAVTLGGGVCANMQVTVGGSVKIAGNTVSGAANNLYLRITGKGASLAVSSDPALTTGADIGISSDTAPTKAAPVAICSTTTDYSSYFHADKIFYAVEFNSNTLKLVTTDLRIPNGLIGTWTGILKDGKTNVSLKVAESSCEAKFGDEDPILLPLSKIEVGDYISFEGEHSGKKYILTFPMTAPLKFTCQIDNETPFGCELSSENALSAPENLQGEWIGFADFDDMGVYCISLSKHLISLPDETMVLDSRDDVKKELSYYFDEECKVYVDYSQEGKITVTYVKKDSGTGETTTIPLEPIKCSRYTPEKESWKFQFDRDVLKAALNVNDAQLNAALAQQEIDPTEFFAEQKFSTLAFAAQNIDNLKRKLGVSKKNIPISISPNADTVIPSVTAAALDDPGDYGAAYSFTAATFPEECAGLSNAYDLKEFIALIHGKMTDEVEPKEYTLEEISNLFYQCGIYLETKQYDSWQYDIVVTADQNIDEGKLTVAAGTQEGMTNYTPALTAGTAVRLLGSSNSRPYSGFNSVTTGLTWDDSLAGTKVTVELRLYNMSSGNETGTYGVLASFDYTIPGNVAQALNTAMSSTTPEGVENVFEVDTTTEPGTTIIKLLDDITLDKSLTVQTGKKVKIDLNGKTIDRGLSQASAPDQDGHVFAVDGELTIVDSSNPSTGKITGGYAYCGGGVVVNGGKFTLESGTITGNKATKQNDMGPYGGGGVYVTNNGTFVLKTGGVITENITDQFGGGVYVEKGYFDMKAGTISKNTVSTWSGGGVAVASTGHFEMESGLISENHADSDAGGGVWTDGLTEIHSGKIEKNTAKSGAGVYAYHGTLNTYGGEISANHATNKGAGVYIDDSVTAYIGGAITGNTAVTAGGGICANTTVTVGGKAHVYGNYLGTSLDDNAKILNNAYVRNSSKQGKIAIITATDGKKTVLDSAVASIGVTTESDSAFTDAYDTDYSAFFKADDATKNVKYNQDKKLEITNGAVVSSEGQLINAINAAGASELVITLASDITLTNRIAIPFGKVITIDLNGHKLDRALSAATAGGYVIFSEGTLKVKDSSDPSTGKLTGGYSDTDGGGVYVKSGSFTLESGTITGNKAKSSAGGVYVGNGASFTMNGGAISQNEAGKAGGGAYVYKGTFTMNSGTISGNKALSHTDFNSSSNNGAGGGIYVDDDCTVSLLGGTISGNHAKTFAGGVGCNGPITVGGTVSVKNNTATDSNTADNVNLRIARANGKGKTVPVINISTSPVLATGAYIGVSADTEPTKNGAVKLVLTTTDCTNFFHADSSAYAIKFNNTTNALELALADVRIDTVEVNGNEIKLGSDEVTVRDQDGNTIQNKDLDEVAEAINDVLDNKVVKSFDDTGLASATDAKNSEIVEALKEETEDGTAKSNISETDISKYLNVKLVSADVDTTDEVIVTAMTFDVTPMATITVTDSSGNPVTLTTEITNDEIDGTVTFLLPVDDSITAGTAAVYHEGAFLGNYEIKESNGSKYIEVSTSSFSEFGYIVLDETTAGAKIGNTLYASLSDAVSRVADNETITLLKDASAAITVSREVKFTVDANGKSNTATIAAGSGYAVSKSGNTYTITKQRSGGNYGGGSSAVTAMVNMPLVKMGSAGESVKTLQTRLNALGYSCGTVDGIFGRQTYAAVVAFQKANSLDVDGIVGPKTWAKLGGSTSTAPTTGTSTGNLTVSSNMPLLLLGSSGDAVKTLQTRLNQLGYSCGNVDGIFGQKTLAAVKSFQTAKGLAVDGIVGNQTWAALQ